MTDKEQQIILWIYYAEKEYSEAKKFTLETIINLSN